MSRLAKKMSFAGVSGKETQKWELVQVLGQKCITVISNS